MSVYVWGSNTHQQLIGQSQARFYSPASVDPNCFDDQVPIQVAAGDQHTLVLCESGEVYSFGNGRDGQLGQGERFERNKKNLVVGLDHETIVHIAAGASSSFAITSTGSVYHWGLVHMEENPVDLPLPNDNMNEAVITGQLTGLAQDQDLVIQPTTTTTTMTTTDPPAPATGSRRERALAALQSGSNRQGGNNAEQTRHLRDIVRESTERWMLPTEEAERQYYEELRAMGYHLDEVEELIQHREEEHTDMLRAVCKRQVQPMPIRIASLERKRIVAIAAGYAHVLALADTGRLFAAGYNDRGQLGLGHRINTSAFKSVDLLSNKFVLQIACGQQHSMCRAIDRSEIDESVHAGSSFGGDVYVWGNGMLGQLGLGRRGTTKGRMVPTLLHSIQKQYPQGAISIAAGANFSVVVVCTGEVYSFGHAEYNQHGTGNSSHLDYVDPFHFFEPRKVCIVSPLRKDAHTVRDGSLQETTEVQISSVTCGAVFTLAIDNLGNLYSWGWNESGVLGQTFQFSSSPQRIEGIGSHAAGLKIMQVSCGGKHVIALAGDGGLPWATAYRQILQEPRFHDCYLVADNHSLLPCHQALLAARSSYLRGFLRAAKQDQTHGNHSLHLTFSGTSYSNVTLRCLLEYLYLDRCRVPEHKLKEVLSLAKQLCLSDWAKQLKPRRFNDKTTTSLSFVNNMLNLLSSDLAAETADVVFASKLLPNEKKLYGHRFILWRIPYFDTFFRSSFADCNRKIECEGREMLEIDISGLLLDGIEIKIFELLLQHAYQGYFGSAHMTENNEGDIDINDVMSLLVAANRLGFSSLAQGYERKIALCLTQATEEDVVLAMEFAREYNLYRLERQCCDLHRTLQQRVADSLIQRKG
eukprot:gene9869-10915_t